MTLNRVLAILVVLFFIFSPAYAQISSPEHMQVVNQQLDKVEVQGMSPSTSLDYQIFPQKPYWKFELASQVSYIRYLEPLL